MEFASSYIAFSAPSGAGKTTIVRILEQKYPQLVISISAATRPRRANETDGHDYYFISLDEFKKEIDKDSFLEYEEVHGQYYGTLIEKIESFTKQGKVVLFDIDVNGAQAVKEHYPEALLFFIKPPGREELIRRLQIRKSETEASIKKRLQRLQFEYEQAENFDYIIINDDLETAVKEIEKIILRP